MQKKILLKALSDRKWEIEQSSEKSSGKVKLTLEQNNCIKISN